MTTTTLTADQAIETLANGYGETLATLTWRNNGNGTTYCQIDNGTITRHDDGSVTVRLQRTGGAVRTYQQADILTAWHTLGLSAHRCNGIDGWAGLTYAGRD